VAFCLAFGYEELSVPVMRRVLGDTLRALGVAEDSVYDLLLAASEACTSVLEHGRPLPEHGGGGLAGYSVVTSLSGAGCRVEVIGPAGRRGGDGRAAADGGAVVAEDGLAVARGCVDGVRLRRGPGRDTVVVLRKHISWSWDAPLRRVSAASRLA
jgi:serine/threonine-protein kinase RsbW